MYILEKIRNLLNWSERRRKKQLCELLTLYPNAVAYIGVRYACVRFSGITFPPKHIDDYGHIDTNSELDLSACQRIQHPDELNKHHIQSILAHQSCFQSLEKELVQTKRTAEIHSQFEKLVEENMERKSYHKRFCDEHHIPNPGTTSYKKFCLERLDELDAYILQQKISIEKRYKEFLYTFFYDLPEFIAKKFGKDNPLALTEREQEYIVDNQQFVIESLLHYGRKRKNELAKTMPKELAVLENDFGDIQPYFNNENVIMPITLERLLLMAKIDRATLQKYIRDKREYNIIQQWNKQQSEFTEQMCNLIQAQDSAWQFTQCDITKELPHIWFYSRTTQTIVTHHFLFPYCSRLPQYNSHTISMLVRLIKSIKENTNRETTVILWQCTTNESNALVQLCNLLSDNRIPFSDNLYTWLPTTLNPALIIVSDTTVQIEVKKCFLQIRKQHRNLYPVITFLSMGNQMEAVELTERLRASTKNWERIENLPYISLFEYSPVVHERTASEKEWHVRNLVWNFKANNHHGESTDERTALNQKAVKELVPLFSKTLKQEFGVYLPMLTLVCAPASDKVTNEIRYATFSRELCDVTGMENSHVYINILKDGEPKHAGGKAKAFATFSYNFFHGKHILLMDDIITQGKTMLELKRKLELYGATVIGGCSIGRTKLHE